MTVEKITSGAIHMNGQQLDTLITSYDFWKVTVSIVTQLKQIEDAFSAPTERPSPVASLNTEDSNTLKKVFSLAPPAFVDAWAQALSLTDKDIASTDKDIYVRAIQSGAQFGHRPSGHPHRRDRQFRRESAAAGAVQDLSDSSSNSGSAHDRA